MFYILLVALFVAAFSGLYSGILKRSAGEETAAVIKLNLCILLGIVIVLFSIKHSESYSRLVVFGCVGISTILMAIAHYYYKRLLRKHFHNKNDRERLLLVAPYAQVSRIVARLAKAEFPTREIIGIVYLETSAQMEAAAAEQTQTIQIIESEEDIPSDIPVVGTIEDVYEYIKTNVVDEVLICADNSEAEQLTSSLLEMGVTVHVSISHLIQVPNAVIGRINGVPVITSSVATVTSKQVIIKRCVDIIFGLAGSVITVILTPFVAAAIYLTDPGPVFFRQERVGKNGRSFKIWKFRTMYQDAEARKAELMSKNKMTGYMFKLDDDPRILGYGKRFSIGKFLRETSIDELPQSFNILAGSMSVVGTRPPTLEETKAYHYDHKGRLAIKPGLTGMWQVSGRSSIIDFDEVVRLDKEYIENFSLTLDLEIILKTFKVVFGRKGAV